MRPHSETEPRRTNLVDQSRRYQVIWEKVPEPARGRAGRWLVVHPGSGTADDVVRWWPAEHLVPLRVDVDDTNRTGLAERLADAVHNEPTLCGVVSLVGSENGLHPMFSAVPRGFAAMLTLLQAYGDAGLTLPLWCLTRGAADIIVEPNPLQAVLFGLGQVAALELPAFWGGLVDLAVETDSLAVSQLPELLSSPDRETELAVRGSAVYVRRLRRMPPVTPRNAWRPRGSALITGGTTGTGAAVARWLAENGTEDIVLTSRRGPAAPGVDALHADLRARGATVSVAAVDAGDHAAVVQLLHDARSRGSVFRTVVHAAGIPQSTPIKELSLAECSAVLGAKLAGAATLDESFVDAELDAFVLFSSIYATWGGPGSAAYTAGNAYLDALARKRRRQGVPMTSMAWGPLGSGMLAQAPPEIKEALRQHGFTPLSGQQASAEMARAVEDGLAAVTIADIDWDRFRAVRGGPLFARLFST
ncbi:beta-ketoacyl reductase [Nocardia sp. NPDC051570]|uniref:beta-ketoacyl reductase n=1 Tax=Nocardia sp. NPDC051570 TaxID=3364324 RepID=UPI0037A46050